MSDITITGLDTSNYPNVQATAVRGSDQATVDVSGSYIIAGADAESKQKDLEVQLLKRALTSFSDFDAQEARNAAFYSNRDDLKGLEDKSIVSPSTPNDPTVSISTTDTLVKVTGSTDTVTQSLTIGLTDQDDAMVYNQNLTEGSEGFATQSYSISLKKADNTGLDTATKLTATVTATNEIGVASNAVSKTWES
jgi:hypothetical protein